MAESRWVAFILSRFFPIGLLIPVSMETPAEASGPGRYADKTETTVNGKRTAFIPRFSNQWSLKALYDIS